MATPADEALGDWVRTRRRALHLSLRKLAGLVGVTNPHLSQVERGLARPDEALVDRLLDVLTDRT